MLPGQRGAGQLLLLLLWRGLGDGVPGRVERLAVLGGYRALLKVRGKRRRRVLWVEVGLLVLDVVAGGGVLGGGGGGRGAGRPPRVHGVSLLQREEVNVWGVHGHGVGLGGVGGQECRGQFLQAKKQLEKTHRILLTFYETFIGNSIIYTILYFFSFYHFGFSATFFLVLP